MEKMVVIGSGDQKRRRGYIEIYEGKSHRVGTGMGIRGQRSFLEKADQIVRVSGRLGGDSRERARCTTLWIWRSWLA